MRTATILKRVPGPWRNEDGPTGTFHGFSVDCDEDGSYATAIIELPDGTVELPRADRIRFTEPTPLP